MVKTKNQNAVYICKKCKKSFLTSKGQRLHFETVHKGARNNKRTQNRKSHENRSLKIVGVNAAGLRSKFSSLDSLITSVQPSVIFLQETKMKIPGKIKTKKSEDYIFFELLRKENKVCGGGLAIGILKCLNPVWISEGGDETEILVTEVTVQKLKIRCITAYGPQNCEKIEKKEQFWARLISEVEDAKNSDRCFLH